MSTATLRNIGPKSAAWLRQVGLRTPDDIRAIGAVEAFAKIRRAGFKPSLNLLYALEGALVDCHWQEIPEARRQALVADWEAIAAAAPPPRGRPAHAPVTTTHVGGDGDRDGDGTSDPPAASDRDGEDYPPASGSDDAAARPGEDDR